MTADDLGTIHRELRERLADRALCDRHGFVFGEDLRLDMVRCASLVMEEATLRIIVEAGPYGQPGTALAADRWTLWLMGEVVMHSPLCCYLGDAEMDRIFAESRVVGLDG